MTEGVGVFVRFREKDLIAYLDKEIEDYFS
jgi:hypothetical protein